LKRALKTPFLAIHAKGGESISPKQKDRTTTPISKIFETKVFNVVFNWYCICDIFQKLVSKTLLNTKRRISLRGSFVKSKEKHLKQGEKISNLENASRNLIHIPLAICKKTFGKNFQKTFAKTKQVVQVWSKMLK
jgi:hypothetical protein